MSPSVAVLSAVLATGGAAACWPRPRGRPEHRLRRSVGGAGPPDRTEGRGPDSLRSVAAVAAVAAVAERRRRRLRRSALVLSVVALLDVLGPLRGLALGVPAAVFADRLLGRLEPATVRRRRARMVDDLPALADLLAVTTRAGIPVERALEVCATAVGGPLGSAIGRVAVALHLGAPPARAWAELLADAVTAPLAVAMTRAADRGLAPTPALRACAGQARRSRAVTAARRAQAVGVSAAAPLGLCFLPAFVLIAVVPTVVGGLGQVLGS